MIHLVFFLEEPSAKAMLEGILPKLLPKDVIAKYIVFEGKQDLEKRLPIRLRAWQTPNSKFVIMRDQDSGNCMDIKRSLKQICINEKKADVLVRIACRELESFYLGDLNAVANATGTHNIAKLQRNAKFRNPDALTNPYQELKNIARAYQKISGSRAIGNLLDIDNNQSSSFNALINGVKRLVGETA